MQFEGALIREQGVEFAVVVVKKHVVDNSSTASEAIRAFSPAFPGVPVVLMAQDSRGVAHYRGRSDIVQFMARVDPRRVPWRKYTWG